MLKLIVLKLEMLCRLYNRFAATPVVSANSATEGTRNGKSGCARVINSNHRVRAIACLCEVGDYVFIPAGATAGGVGAHNEEIIGIARSAGRIITAIDNGRSYCSRN